MNRTYPSRRRCLCKILLEVRGKKKSFLLGWIERNKKKWHNVNMKINVRCIISTKYVYVHMCQSLLNNNSGPRTVIHRKCVLGQHKLSTEFRSLLHVHTHTHTHTHTQWFTNLVQQFDTVLNKLGDLIIFQFVQTLGAEQLTKLLK